MRVMIAPDKFKESLSALQAAEAMALGVLAAVPGASVDLAPMADGGEGTVDALVAATGGTYRQARVSGPLGDPVIATFGLLGDGRTAAIEMASASGLALVPHERRNPMIASTRGTGELLLAAIAAGARRVIVGIGGSATNDGGAGLGQALGFRLLDADGHEVGPGGGNLERLARIDPTARHPELEGVEIAIACDVTNPLCGPRGASAIYGPQKGATPTMVDELDKNLARFAAIVERDLGASIRDVPGSGAAGGLGGGLVAFAVGELEPGVNLVIEAINLAHRLADADLCLTGEGAIDEQSAFGKTAVGVGRLARDLGCPTLAFTGTIKQGAEAVLAEGIDAYFSICDRPITLDEAKARASALLERATEQAVRGVHGRATTTPEIIAKMNQKDPLGEFGLIAWIRERERLRPGGWTNLGIGDDCAILRVPSGAELLVTTDMLMDGRHFRLISDGAEAVGYKALGVNLSDIAAMAGIPRAAVVAVALPRDGAVALARGIHAGMAPLADRFGVELVGGDTNAWDGPLVISVTVLGQATGPGAVRRSGARPGDSIFVTGPLGGSLAAGRHLRPEPRVTEALDLNQSMVIHAMIDISDGFASDLSHILEESGGLGAILDAASIPIHEDAREISHRDGRTPIEHALNDGEDFELCLTVPGGEAPPLPHRLYRIGEIQAGEGLWLRDADGRLKSIEPRGFDHLRSADR